MCKQTQGRTETRQITYIKIIMMISYALCRRTRLQEIKGKLSKLAYPTCFQNQSLISKLYFTLFFNTIK